MHASEPSREPRRTLITGATSGLGRAMALQLAARGERLALTGRRAERLAETAAAARAAGASEVIELLGSVNDDEVVREHAEHVRAAFGRVDLAILNAGVGIGEDARDYTVDAYARALDTNVLGVSRWIEAVLPTMLETGSGIIAGVSSPGGWRGFAGIGPYAASKAALSTMLESMRVDLRGSGVRVVTVSPGFVKSEMTAGNDPRSMPGLLETDEGARRILRGIDRGHRHIHFPRRLTVPLALAARLLPGPIFEAVAARAGRHPRS